MEEPNPTGDNTQAADNAGGGQPNPLGVNPEPQHEYQTTVTDGYQRQSEDDGERLAREIGEAFVAKLKVAKLSEIVLGVTSVALVIIGFSQVIVAWENYRDTSPLVGYARETKDAAKKFADESEKNTAAAQQFATNAGLINVKIGDAVGRLDAQAKATQSAAQAAAKQLELIDRPWISVEFTPTSGIAFTKDGTLQMSINTRFKNVGHAVATKIFVNHVEFVTSDPFEVVLSRQEEACNKASMNKRGMNSMGITLFPNTDDDSLGIGVNITMTEIMANLADTHFDPAFHDKIFGPIYMVGCVDYRYSASPIHHQTRFAYRIGRKLANAPRDLVRAIKVGENVPLEDIKMTRYMFGGDQAY